MLDTLRKNLDFWLGNLMVPFDRSRRELYNALGIVSNGANLTMFWSFQSFRLVPVRRSLSPSVAVRRRPSFWLGNPTVPFDRSRRELQNALGIVSNGRNLTMFWSLQSTYGSVRVRTGPYGSPPPPP